MLRGFWFWVFFFVADVVFCFLSRRVTFSRWRVTATAAASSTPSGSPPPAPPAPPSPTSWVSATELGGGGWDGQTDGRTTALEETPTHGVGGCPSSALTPRCPPSFRQRPSTRSCSATPTGGGWRGPSPSTFSDDDDNCGSGYRQPPAAATSWDPFWRTDDPRRGRRAAAQGMERRRGGPWDIREGKGRERVSPEVVQDHRECKCRSGGSSPPSSCLLWATQP